MTQKYESAVERMIVGIQTDYLNWGKRTPYADQYNEETLNEKFPIAVVEGRKYDKIFTGTSIWGFVAKSDGVLKGIPYKEGDVFKPAGLGSPAKHVRGSIYDENQNWFSWTGPRYL